MTKITPTPGADVQLPEAMGASSLGWKLPGTPPSYCLNLQAHPCWPHLIAQRPACPHPTAQEPQAPCILIGPMANQGSPKDRDPASAPADPTDQMRPPAGQPCSPLHSTFLPRPTELPHSILWLQSEGLSQNHRPLAVWACGETGEKKPRFY